MAIVTRDDLFARLNERIGEDNSDEALALIEDFSDTFDSLSVADTEDWKSKYEENDKAWREKYRARFMSPSEAIEEQKEDVIDDSEEKSFEDLFEEREG